MHLSLAFLSKALTYADGLGAMSQLILLKQVLHRFAYINITYVHLNC